MCVHIIYKFHARKHEEVSLKLVQSEMSVKRAVEMKAAAKKAAELELLPWTQSDRFTNIVAVVIVATRQKLANLLRDVNRRIGNDFAILQIPIRRMLRK